MSKKYKQVNQGRLSSFGGVPLSRAGVVVACALLAVVLGTGGCRSVGEKLGISAVRPRALRDVPAARLAFRL
ncbi:MAG TPA: hypothetical protein VGB61_15835, partial [Pyrinomonadaceae bacterium]